MSGEAGLRVLLWTVDKRHARTRTGAAAKTFIAAQRADLICLTEASPNLLPEGHWIASHPFSALRVHPSVRKVVLWSRHPWNDVDEVGHQDLPPSRFVQGATQTALGTVTVTGVCIPWPDAGSEHGRARWEEHGRYLEALDLFLQRSAGASQLLLGDFNQHIPRTSERVAMATRLAQVMEGRFRVATAGDQPPPDQAATPVRTIEHLAHGAALTCTSIALLGQYLPDGTRMSDRPALILTLTRA